MEINGEPGAVSYLDGKPHLVLTFGADEGRIHATYILTSPEKLAHLPALQPLQIRQPCHKSRSCAVFCLGCKVRRTLALN